MQHLINEWSLTTYERQNFMEQLRGVVVVEHHSYKLRDSLRDQGIAAVVRVPTDVSVLDCFWRSPLAAHQSISVGSDDSVITAATLIQIMIINPLLTYFTYIQRRRSDVHVHNSHNTALHWIYSNSITLFDLPPSYIIEFPSRG